jgi:aspartate carbamoyltransferase regulatory subunit
MVKTRSVSAINNGVVIDHITVGQALKIMRLLQAPGDRQRVTLGLNLTSKRLGFKDLIKIENRDLNPNEIEQVSVFSAFATINRIVNFTVFEKVKCRVPETIRGILICPNRRCISRIETKSYFRLHGSQKDVWLHCFYCEKLFKRDQLHEHQE